MDKMKYYVYIHYKATDKTPFYVGKGKGKRVNVFKGRNRYWFRVFNCHGCIPKIIETFEQEKDALQFEMYLIKKLRAEGLKLCNLTDGGEGMSGYTPTKATRLKISQNHADLSGDNNPMRRLDVRLACSGSGNANFHGVSVAKTKEGVEVGRYVGNKELLSAGFAPGQVSMCVNGKIKTHKKLYWTREKA